MRGLWVVGVGGLILVLWGCSHQQEPAPVTPAYTEPGQEAQQGAMAMDERTALQQLLSRMHRVNMFGMEIDELARTNRASAQVQQLASEIATHRANLEAQVQRIAERENIELVEPTPFSEADREVMSIQNAVLQDLRNMKGENFDRLFLTSVVVSRAEVLPLLRDLAPEITDQEIKSMISNSIPMLEQEYARALDMLANRYRGTTTEEQLGAR